jgi:hypothetical protein
MPSAEDNKKSKKDKVKKSGVRTKFLIESLRNDYYSLREENGRLRQLVTDNLAEDAAKSVLAECFDLNAPKAKVTNLDDLAAGVEDEEAEAGDDSDVGF